MHYLEEEYRRAVTLGSYVGRVECWLPVQAATFGLLLELGLQDNSRVLDVGAGAFRVGAPIIAKVGAANYHAIEPNTGVCRAGRESLNFPGIGYTDTDDFSFTDLLGSYDFYDFVVARSIWSHAARWQIKKMLDEFVKVGQPGAKFLASFYAANWWNPRRWPYYGKKWHYKGITRRPGTRHTKAWITRECKARGLTVEFRDWLGLGQPWAIIRKGWTH